MRRYRREKIRGAAVKGKLVYLSISLSDIVILFDVVCYKPNSIFTVCWKQNWHWRCVLHKTVLSQCAVDKFPLIQRCAALLRVCQKKKARSTPSLSPQLVFESPHGSGASLLVKLHSACSCKFWFIMHPDCFNFQTCWFCPCTLVFRVEIK